MIICFHNPDEENGYLSNWYMSDFVIDGVKFSSMEKYMMYQKAQTFRDFEIAQKILKSNDVAQIKAYGRQVSNYEEVIWNGIRQLVVYRGLTEKFSQNRDLRKRLVETEDAVLAECAVQDKIWGIGLSMNDPNRLDIHKWKGNNLLGFTLMKVREGIQHGS